MRPQPLKLGPGSDLRLSLEQLAIAHNAHGFVLGVVGNLSRAVFQCPGPPGPTVLEGDLEIITLNGTVSPEGVHLHLSLSDGACQVWGGHLEHGTLVLKGADLLVGFLDTAAPAPEPLAVPPTPLATGTEPVAIAPPAVLDAMAMPPQPLAMAPQPMAMAPQPVPATAAAIRPLPTGEPRLEIAVGSGCPWSARALRMLRTLGIPHRVQRADSQAERQALVDRSGLITLPQVFIDGQCIGGYEALAELHGRGVLDALRA